MRQNAFNFQTYPKTSWTLAQNLGLQEIWIQLNTRHDLNKSNCN